MFQFKAEEEKEEIKHKPEIKEEEPTKPKVSYSLLSLNFCKYQTPNTDTKSIKHVTNIQNTLDWRSGL